MKAPIAKLILLILLLAACPELRAQKEVPDWDRRGFLNHVLSDFRNESDVVVFNLSVDSYSGPVIGDAITFFMVLAENGIISTDSIETINSRKIGIEILMSGDTLTLASDSRIKEWLEFPPIESDCYTYRKRSRNFLIRKFFDKDLFYKGVKNYQDALALDVVLFEKNIPLCTSGYGNYLDLSKEDRSQDPKD